MNNSKEKPDSMSIFFKQENSNRMQVTNLSIVIETVENKDELIPNVKTPERILNEDISIK